jgi:putative PIN family toxin of toxin-antitoxin system
MIRAVIDTNVLVSAMISSAGNEALVLMAINQGLVMPCFSPEILDEYSEVLCRPRFGFLQDGVSALLEMLRRRGSLLNSHPLARTSPDPDDDKFIACALTAKADFLVTGNKRHFLQSPSLGARVVSAGELLEFITLQRQ